MDTRAVRIILVFFGLSVAMIGFSMFKGYEYRKTHPEVVVASDITKEIAAKGNKPVVNSDPFVVQDYYAGEKFDNSTCPKLDSNLHDLELVRQQDWFDYHTTWKAHLNSKLVVFMNTAVSSLGQLYLDDTRMLGWAAQMPQCYTTRQNTEIKSYLAQAKKNLAIIPSWYDKGYLFPNDVYPKYISIRDLINSFK
jgi:hypothetical protein